MDGVVAEIETQAAGFDDAAGLLDMLAEDLAEGRLEQMSGGVIAHGGAARRFIDNADEFVAGFDGTQDADLLDHGVGRRFVCAFDDGYAFAGFGIEEQAGVADLAAGFGVERCFGEDDFGFTLIDATTAALSTMSSTTSTGDSRVSRPMNSTGARDL